MDDNSTPTVNPDDAFILEFVAQIKNLDEMIKQIKQELSEVSSAFGEDIAKQIKDNIDAPDAHSHKESEAQKKEDEDHEKKLLSSMAEGLDKISDAGMDLLKGVFEFIQDIFAQLKKSSPLLQAIEQLFNLAWTLFFMPIGNKLGEMLIPAVIDLMDDVMAIWDAFEGMTLGEMFSYAIKMGVEILGEFLLSIGGMLSEQGGLIGAIGNMLTSIGGFLQDSGEELLNTLVGVATFVVDHLKDIIAAIVGFKVASLTMQTMLIYATAVSGSVAGLFGAGLVVAGTAGVAAYGISRGAMTAMGMDDNRRSAQGTQARGVSSVRYPRNDDLPAVGGGSPLSTVDNSTVNSLNQVSETRNSSRNNNSYTININSYSTEEIKTVVKDVVSDEISQSRLRSGY